MQSSVLAGALFRVTAPVISALLLSFACKARPEPRESKASGEPPRISQAAARPAAEPPPPAEVVAQAPPEAAKRSVVLVAGGDVSFGRECGTAILKDPAYDPFRFVAPLWKTADFRFVNLESQLSDQKGETVSPRNWLVFTGPPGGASVLSNAGVDVVSTANNHAWDYGKKAMFETLANLKGAGVKAVGTGATLDEAHEPVMLEAAGVKIAVFAVTHIWNYGPIENHAGRKHVAWARWDALEDAVKRARKKADFVLLSYHGGAEYVDVPAYATRRFVKAAMGAGVDVVIGHHPHVPQGVAWFDDRPVFFSLGNFVFESNVDKYWVDYGMLARLTLEPGKPPRAQGCPYFIDRHTPKPLGPKDPANARFRDHLCRISTSVGGSFVGEPDAEGCYDLSPPEPRPPDPPPAGRGSAKRARR